MAMVNINVVARIAGDKNSFIDMVVLAHKLKEENLHDFSILFIGDILNDVMYSNLVRLASLLDVSDKIGFTKKSIRFAEMSAEIKAGYFLNYTIGTFMGYSGVESIRYGLKTIFYNASARFQHETSDHINFCPNLTSIVKLAKLIEKDKQGVDREIMRCNSVLNNNYKIDDKDKTFLLSVMLPGQL